MKKDVEIYLKKYDLYLAFKTIIYKIYQDFESVLISTYR